MPTYPTSPRPAFLQWCQAHVNVFNTQAANIGLTDTQAQAFQAAVAAAAGSLIDVQSAKDASRAATASATDRFSLLRASAAEMVRSIRTFAENTNNQAEVYQLAQISAPASPSPAPPPGQPFMPRVTLLENGAIRLAWKCNNPSGTQGTIYEVRRRVGGQGAFAFIGASGVKSFDDGTIPAGASQVTYEITAVRSTQRGVPAQFNVNFGVGGPGLVSVTLSEPGAMDTPKLAA